MLLYEILVQQYQCLSEKVQTFFQRWEDRTWSIMTISDYIPKY